MIPRMLPCLGLLCMVLPAQAGGDRPAPDARVQESLENEFYRAFFLQRGERRYDQAVALYQKFVESAPDHRYARRAAEGAIECLRASGKQDAALELAQKYAALLGRAGTEPQAPAGEKAAGDAAPAADARAEERRRELQSQLESLEAELERARAANDAAEVQRLERRVARVQRTLAGGDAGAGAAEGGDRGEGRRGRGRLQINFAEMNDEQITQSLERIEQMRGPMIERMRENGQEKEADEMQKQWADLKKLLEEGKKADAQKLWEQMMPRRRGG